jgi:hypothetical protein
MGPKTTNFEEFYVFTEGSTLTFTFFCPSGTRLFRILLFKPAVWGLAGQQICSLAGRLFNFHLIPAGVPGDRSSSLGWLTTDH